MSGGTPTVAGVNDGKGVAISPQQAKGWIETAQDYGRSFGKGLKWAAFLGIVVTGAVGGGIAGSYLGPAGTVAGVLKGSEAGAAVGGVLGAGAGAIGAYQAVGDPNADPQPAASAPATAAPATSAPVVQRSRFVDVQETSEGGGVAP